MRALTLSSLTTLSLAAALVLTPSTAHAQERSDTAATVTTITMVAGAATVTLMPRIFHSDPETTVGWKARWHVSILAPSLANVTLTLLNEHALKDAIRSPRPGCDETNQGTGRCQDFGSLSSHTFLAASAFGQGTAIFLSDMLKWNDGRFNVGSFLGNVAFPLVFAGVTAVGRTAGDWEDGGTVALSGVSGLVTGGLMGLGYAVLQRPECGYTGSLVCW